MEQENLMRSMLELVERPAFCVSDETVVQVNRSARQKLVAVGTRIYDLLSEDEAVYRQFQGEAMTLNVEISGIRYTAQVTKIGNAHIFVLENDDPQLRAIALASQHLRAPLNSLISVTELISCDDNQYKHQLHRSLNRLHRIVCNMSDSYRYQHSSTANMEVIDIPAVFTEAMEAVRAHLENCDIHLQYTEPNLSVYGLADREMLERAIYNMVSNAVKFMVPGGVLTAKLTQTQTQLSFALQAPADADEYADIFHSYQREPCIEDSRRGLGLGMPLIRAVASAHGGTVLVDHPEDNTVRITMTIRITEPSEPVVRNSIRLPVSNYAGGRDRGLLELSEILPADAYKNMD